MILRHCYSHSESPLRHPSRQLRQTRCAHHILRRRPPTGSAIKAPIWVDRLCAYELVGALVGDAERDADVA